MKTFLSKISLKSQLNLFITMGISTIIILVILINYSKNQEALINNELKTGREILKTEIDFIDIYIKEIELYSLMSWQNPDFTNTISSKESLSFNDNEIITNQIIKMLQARNDVDGITMYLKNQDKVFNCTRDKRGTLLTISDYTNFDILYPLSEVENNPNFYNIEKDENNKNHFIFHRGIIDIETKEVICLISITFNDSYLDAFLNNEYSSSLIKYLVSDDIIYYNNAYSNFSLDNFDRNSLYFTVDDTEYLANTLSSNIYDYEIILFKNSKGIKNELVQARNVSILLMIFLIGLSFLCISIFTSFFTKPLYELGEKLKDVGNGNFKTKINISGSSEITELANNFNNMTEEIDQLVNKTYLAQINENMAKLIALEAQINPHFLNNTLQAISTEALLNDQDKIYEMINTLAQMLRYTIKNDDTVSIREELDHVSQYILIQKYRFNEQLECIINVDNLTDKNTIKIPKLSIHTLVENCIEHGMKTIEHKLIININVYTEKDYAFIEVMDNGCGISKIDLENLQNKFINWENTFKSEKDNIGITNLYSRLKLLFNNKATFDILNVKPSGTLIVIKIPLS